MRLLPHLFALIALACTTAARAAPPAGNDLVGVKLLADVSTIEAGKSFTVGVLFKIAPHWHIYWINPGDAGQPTDVRFTLPPGFTVSELKFPVPQRLVAPGDIVSYGYEDEVMLMATVTPPSDLKPGDKITISAEASWLVCEKICLPGDSKIKLELAVAAKSAASNVDLFARWMDRIPRLYSDTSVNVKTMDSVRGNGHQITLVTRWPDPAPKNLEIFPPASDTLTFTNLKIDGQQDPVLMATVTPLPGKSIPPNTTLSWTIAYDGPDGVRRGIVFPMTLK